MKRWHAELQLMQTRHEAHTGFHGTDSNKLRPGGYFRKNRPFDCGHSRCYKCHGLKLLHESTDAELLADQNLREQVEEISAARLVSERSIRVLEAFAASI
ncbi:MAG: hypothetical protein SFV17_05265 [Candidatus Obscuribacter sp.]|nr:hypothetical protein [Candidatus Obscuribacter sp.]